MEKTIVEMEKDENYKTIFSSGALANIRSDGGSLIFYLDEDQLIVDKQGSIVRDKVIKKLLLEIKMSPLEFIQMSKWLYEISTEFENALADVFSAEE